MYVVMIVELGYVRCNVRWVRLGCVRLGFVVLMLGSLA